VDFSRSFNKVIKNKSKTTTPEFITLRFIFYKGVGPRLTNQADLSEPYALLVV